MRVHGRVLLAALAFIVLSGLVSNALASETPVPEREVTVPLWPLLYRSADAEQKTLEVAWPLWSSSTTRDPHHRVNAVLWPLTRFSKWLETGDHNNFIFPFFWGQNTPEEQITAALVPNKYAILFPLYWGWKNAKARHTVIPPGYIIKYADGRRRYGVLPLFWRATTASGAFTVLVPFWHKRMPLGIKSAGIFPLVWYFNLKKLKTLVVIPAWYSSGSGMKTFGAFPLGWHIRNARKKTTHTNLLLLGNTSTSPDGFNGSLFPVAWFSHNKKKLEDFWMMFPFWWGKNPKHVFACTFPFAWSYDRKERRLDNWCLAPLYWRFRDLDVKNPLPLHNLNAFFPIYGKNRGPSEGQSWTFLLFPTYVQSRKGNEKSHYLVFPFMGYKTAPEQYGFHLFPLTKWTWNHSANNPSTDGAFLLGFLGKYVRKKDSLSWRFLRFSLWLPPIASYERKPGSLHAKLTALFQYKRSAGITKWNVLYFLMRGTVREHEKSFFAIAPFFISTKQTKTFKQQLYTPLYYNRRDYHARGPDQPPTTRRHINVMFPVSYYDRGEKGRLEWSFLDPLSFFPDDKDIKRHYSALLHLLDYKKRDDNSTAFRFLWRFFHRTVKPDQRSLEVFPFIHTSSGPKKRRFSLGWRLFEYNREGKRRSLRLLFSPRISWGGKKPTH